MKTGIELIAEERQEQLQKHGWSADHDSKYYNDELLDAAVQYIGGDIVDCWPDGWDKAWYKPSDKISNLKKAGALIAAALDLEQSRMNNRK